MFKKMMMLFLMGFSVSAFAGENLMGGDRVGNGGDVVVCGRKVELLDIYEARTSGYEINKPQGRTYQEMLVNTLINNLQPIQPKRAEKYLKYLETFEQEAQFLPGVQLSDVDDAGMVVIPKGCKLQQIAIQLSDAERPAGKKRYTVSLDLWNKLDEFNKMSLVLHEIIYREAINHKTSNSMIVRAMVGEILKTKIDLDIFISLVADLSSSIEFKKYNWTLCDSCKVVADTYENEYKEKVLRFHDKELALIYEGYQVPTPEVEVRVIDGKILNAGKWFQVFRANKPQQVEDFYNNRVVIETSTEVEYVKGNFLGVNNTKISFSFLAGTTFNLNFYNVNNLSWSYWNALYSGYAFKGSFAIDYNKTKIEYGENNLIATTMHGGVIEVRQDKNSSLIDLRNGVFNCRTLTSFFESYSNNNLIMKLADCLVEGTLFNLLINKQMVPVSLVSKSNITFDDRGMQSDLNIVLANRLFIGINEATREDVFLEKGLYLIHELGRAPYSQFGYTISKDNIHYNLRNDGIVVITVE